MSLSHRPRVLYGSWNQSRALYYVGKQLAVLLDSDTDWVCVTVDRDGDRITLKSVNDFGVQTYFYTQITKAVVLSDIQ